jgi:hypothetical protein
MKRIICFSSFVLVLVACGKDRFETKPQLELKSQSTSVVPVQGNLQLVFEFRDKEGDVADTLFYKKERINIRKVETKTDSLQLAIPAIPNTQKGEFVVDFDYQGYLISAIEAPRVPGSTPPQYESDTLNLKFVLKDKAGNKSDTVRINNLIVLRTS